MKLRLLTLAIRFLERIINKLETSKYKLAIKQRGPVPSEEESKLFMKAMTRAINESRARKIAWKMAWHYMKRKGYWGDKYAQQCDYTVMDRIIKWINGMKDMS